MSKNCVLWAMIRRITNMFGGGVFSKIIEKWEKRERWKKNSFLNIIVFRSFHGFCSLMRYLKNILYKIERAQFHNFFRLHSLYTLYEKKKEKKEMRMPSIKGSCFVLAFVRFFCNGEHCIIICVLKADNVDDDYV